jgi:hypothetical protein
MSRKRGSSLFQKKKSQLTDPFVSKGPIKSFSENHPWIMNSEVAEFKILINNAMDIIVKICRKLEIVREEFQSQEESDKILFPKCDEEGEECEHSSTIFYI